ncbi:MAG TPA: spore coat U domain-containing protein [Gammaproteobacteria bacterium]|nr:spore coat U domain-containing protein [Gammaproteobacteria bacterium]
MNTKTFPIKSVAVIAGVALIPTAAVFMSGIMSNAIAATTTQAVNVSANVNANCKLSNPVTVAFGNYDPIDVNFSTDLLASGSFDIRCTKGVTAALTINNGNNFSSPNRRMIGGTDNSVFLTYQLYTTSGRTIVWDSTVGGTVSYTAASSSNFTETIYGTIPSGQSVSAQAYSDSVTVTATF